MFSTRTSTVASVDRLNVMWAPLRVGTAVNADTTAVVAAATLWALSDPAPNTCAAAMNPPVSR
jgi:hypothetical protein